MTAHADNKKLCREDTSKKIKNVYTTGFAKCFKDNQISLNDNSAQYVPDLKRVETSYYNQRRKMQPKNPKNLDDIDLKDDYTTTVNGDENFLLFDTKDIDLAKLQDFVTYFTNTWINGGFEPTLWNHHNTNTPRTNNHVGGHNNAINNYIAQNKPNIYQAINHLKILDFEASVRYLKLSNKQTQPKKRKLYYVEKDKKINDLKNDLICSVLTPWQFIKKIAFMYGNDNKHPVKNLENAIPLVDATIKPTIEPSNVNGKI